jgi:hypothetical protein
MTTIQNLSESSNEDDVVMGTPVQNVQNNDVSGILGIEWEKLPFLQDERYLELKNTYHQKKRAALALENNSDIHVSASSKLSKTLIEKSSEDVKINNISGRLGVEWDRLLLLQEINELPTFKEKWDRLVLFEEKNELPTFKKERDGLLLRRVLNELPSFEEIDGDSEIKDSYHQKKRAPLDAKQSNK